MIVKKDFIRKKHQLSELRYRRLFETAQDGILILDATSGKIDDVNPSLKKLIGYSESELLGKGLWEIEIFKDIIDSKATFDKLQANGDSNCKDVSLKTKKGRTIYVEFTSNIYMVDTQKVIQCNIHDITNRKKAEEAIKARTKDLEDLGNAQEEVKEAMLNVMEDLESAKNVIELEKAKAEAMLASIGDGLIAVDNDRKVIVVNKIAESMLGWKMKDLIGKEVTDLPLADEAGNLIPLNKRPTTIALTTNEITKVFYYFIRPDKTKFPIAITATPIKLNGKTIGLIEILRDITLEKEIDKSKSEFISLASHQLRTPLGIMKWHLEALENKQSFTQLPNVVQEYFHEIYKNNERVLSLVRDLLSVSRIEQGRVKDDPKSVDLIQLVKEVVKQMQIKAQKKNVTLLLTIKNDKPTLINIDPLRFHQVIENLIANAIEYTNNPKRVDVTVTKVGESFLIKVKDSGIGISKEDQKRLFTKFFRSEKAIMLNPEGSGLGLYLVKSYVEGWGGKIFVKSIEGKGSTFTIFLPIR